MFCTTNQSFVTAYFSSLQTSLDVQLREAIATSEAIASTPHPNVYAITCDLASLKRIANSLCDELTVTSQSQIVCHVSDRPEVSTSELMHTRNLTELNEWVESHWVGQVIAERRLTTYFQPIICNRSNLTFGYECLMRGLENGQKVIAPLRLISAARKCGKLQELDELARITAIQNARRLGLDNTSYFINFSPRNLNRDMKGMQRTIDAALQAGIPPERFVFELTESEEIEEVDFVIDVLNLFRQAGFKIALDDIGAGYNSLTRLADIQPDFVKIDIDLIRGVNEDPFKSCVTAKLLELSRELKVFTVVEGVETIQEWEWSKEHGADFAQGYYFAKPSPDPVNDPLATHA